MRYEKARREWRLRGKKDLRSQSRGSSKRTADDVIVTKAVAELSKSHGNFAGIVTILAYIAADEYE
jgi:hypothetical protein